LNHAQFYAHYTYIEVQNTLAKGGRPAYHRQ
jgi:hypothetical protein